MANISIGKMGILLRRFRDAQESWKDDAGKKAIHSFLLDGDHAEREKREALRAFGNSEAYKECADDIEREISLSKADGQ